MRWQMFPVLDKRRAAGVCGGAWQAACRHEALARTLQAQADERGVCRPLYRRKTSVVVGFSLFFTSRLQHAAQTRATRAAICAGRAGLSSLRSSSTHSAR